MARKSAAAEQPYITKRIAREFQRYLRSNPGMPRLIKVAAFDRIADKHLDDQT